MNFTELNLFAKIPTGVFKHEQQEILTENLFPFILFQKLLHPYGIKMVYSLRLPQKLISRKATGLSPDYLDHSPNERFSHRIY